MKPLNPCSANTRLAAVRPRHPRRPRHHPRSPRREAATLFEVAIGLILISALLIPTAHVMTSASNHARRSATIEELTFLAEDALQQAKIRPLNPPVGGTRTRTENATSDLLPRVRVRYEFTRPTANLLDVSVTTWNEVNRNRRPDIERPQITLRNRMVNP